MWICVDGAQVEAKNLTWLLNDEPTEPVIIENLSSIHKSDSSLTVGLFEFPKPNVKNSLAIIEARALDQTAQIRVKSLPEALPEQDWFRILLCSCYHQAEDRQGLVSQTYLNIAAVERQDLSLFMGDQVYLDLPTLNNYPDDEAKLAKRFEHYYRTNWTTYLGLDALLKNAPAVFCPDDHEYWNNFPHKSPIIQNSWKSDSQKRWKNAADQLYDSFQITAPATRGDNVEIDVDSLSIMVLDQRSQREADRSSALGSTGLKQLNNWVDRLIEEKKIGAIVTGQSLLDRPVSEFQGAIADWMLANYGDYESVVKSLKRLSDAGKPVLLLTGDVHWGRVTKIREAGRTKFIEIICSPSSLVTTVGSDQLKNIGAGFRKFFKGEENRWPRHSSAPDTEPYFAQQVFGKRYQTETIYKHKGDQFAMLGLRKAANTLEAKVTYYEIHKNPKAPREVKLGLLR